MVSTIFSELVARGGWRALFGLGVVSAQFHLYSSVSYAQYIKDVGLKSYGCAYLGMREES